MGHKLGVSSIGGNPEDCNNAVVWNYLLKFYSSRDVHFLIQTSPWFSKHHRVTLLLTSMEINWEQLRSSQLCI